MWPADGEGNVVVEGRAAGGEAGKEGPGVEDAASCPLHGPCDLPPSPASALAAFCALAEASGVVGESSCGSGLMSELEPVAGDEL